MKKIFALLLAIILVIALGACGSETKKSASALKVLKVGTDPDFPPFEYYLKDKNVFTGSDIELVQLLSKKMGYDKVEFIPTPFDKLLTDLDAKKYDLAIGALVSTPERKAGYALSDAYLKTFSVALGKKVGTKLTGEKDREKIKGKRLVAEKGSFLVKLAEIYSKDTTECKDTEDGVKLVLAGKADYVITNQHVGKFLINNGYGKDIEVVAELKGTGKETFSEVCMAMRKDDTKLATDVNKALKEIMRSGEFKELLTSYFGK